MEEDPRRTGRRIKGEANRRSYNTPYFLFSSSSSVFYRVSTTVPRNEIVYVQYNIDFEIRGYLETCNMKLAEFF